MKLTAAKRKAMPAKDFADGKGKFPISDPTHARLAVSGATRAEHAGNISTSKEAEIKARARAKLKAMKSDKKKPAASAAQQLYPSMKGDAA